jgi:plasmid stability protein
MKTTVDLPDDLMRAVKVRAAHENRRLRDVMAELLQRGLSRVPVRRAAVRKRVRLPLVRCAHEARPDEEMTPDRVAALLLQDEASASLTPRGPVR